MDDRIELVELKQGDRVLFNWASVDFSSEGREFQVEQLLPPKFPEPHLYQTELVAPYYLYLRIRLNGSDREFPYNAAAARGPWAWTSPVFWEWEE